MAMAASWSPASVSWRALYEASGEPYFYEAFLDMTRDAVPARHSQVRAMEEADRTRHGRWSGDLVPWASE
jgi:hypothetical protein